MEGALKGGGISKVAVHRAGLVGMVVMVDMAGVAVDMAVEGLAWAADLAAMAAEAEGINGSSNNPWYHPRTNLMRFLSGTVSFAVRFKFRPVPAATPRQAGISKNFSLRSGI